MMFKSLFRLLAKALGAKEGKTDSEANKVAFIRMTILAIEIATCILISANILVRWGT